MTQPEKVVAELLAGQGSDVVNTRGARSSLLLDRSADKTALVMHPMSATRRHVPSGGATPVEEVSAPTCRDTVVDDPAMPQRGYSAAYGASPSPNVVVPMKSLNTKL